jgi:NADH:ubiquinone oxidoreductase subunit K
MNIKKLLTKYSILLLIYIGLIRFAKPYGLQLYYTLHSQPDMMPEDVRMIQSAFITITFLLNLILAIFILVDSKQKKSLDWFLVVITFFSAETGITLFLIWQIYKDLNKKYEAQHAV